jgi:hypothetical protein
METQFEARRLYRFIHICLEVWADNIIRMSRPGEYQIPQDARWRLWYYYCDRYIYISSCIYEISSGKRPQPQEGNSGKGIFLDRTNVGILGPIMHGGWKLEFDTMAAVLKRIEGVKCVSFGP